MDFAELMEKRYSVRKLSDMPVSDEQIRLILEAARHAPTAVNKQPFKIWVLKSDSSRMRVEDSNNFEFVNKAPVIFIVGASPDAAWVRPADQYNFAPVDAAIAATSMMYEITNLGLGTTWVGHFDPEKLKKSFPQMKPYLLVAIFGVGYPAEDASPHPKHFQRKTLEELSEYI